MHILIAGGPFIPIPPPKYGGTELIIYYLIKGLKELGHKVTLLASADSKVECDLIPITEKAMYFPSTKKDKSEFLKKVKEVEEYTESLIQQLAPRVDIVHSHGVDLIKFADTPNLTTMHGPIIMEQLSYYLNRKSLYYASISENQQAALPELNFVDVIYNGEDPMIFPYVETPEDYICFLGRFDREKNPHLAIQLAITLGMKIKIAGKIDHQAEGYFDEEIEKYLEHPLVEYMGELDFDQKVELLSKAKCNLHPTGFREPFGLTVLEAAYCGTPTLAINRGSMPELIEVGRTGELVEDFVEGYRLIEKCFEMDRRYIANRARLLFNYQNMAKHYVQAYESVINDFNQKTVKKKRALTLV